MDTRRSPQTTLTGSIIGGRYELCAHIARGGMGTVYRGWDHRRSRPVAVKVIALPSASDRYSGRPSEQWWWEARVMDAVRHPHVVRFYDAIADRAHGFIVMEAVEGSNLKRYLTRTGPLAYAEVLRIGIQVCRALHVLHTHGFIHCDLKPHNIIRTPDGRVKLADFGLARHVRSCQHNVHAPPSLSSVAGDVSSGIVAGTATYCSPEQALCEPLAEATDVYSLGVVLYELLAGIPPFSGETPLRVLTLHTTAPVPPLHRRRPDVPPMVEQVVLRALEKHPDRRFRSARAMCAALEQACQSLGGADAAATAQTVRRPGMASQRAPAQPMELRHPPPTAAGPVAGPTPRRATPRDSDESRAQHEYGRDRTDAAHGWRGTDGGSGEPTSAARAPASAIDCYHMPGARMLALCVANAVGLLLLFALLSWIH